MTRTIILRAAARSDLAHIVSTSIPRWGADRTADYVAEIHMAIQRVAVQPEIASDRSHIAMGLRKINSGSHAVYFFFDRQSLRVARILHVSQDVGSKSFRLRTDPQ